PGHKPCLSPTSLLPGALQQRRGPSAPGGPLRVRTRHQRLAGSHRLRVRRRYAPSGLVGPPTAGDDRGATARDDGRTAARQGGGTIAGDDAHTTARQDWHTSVEQGDVATTHRGRRPISR